jgi:hypothetical protein
VANHSNQNQEGNTKVKKVCCIAVLLLTTLAYAKDKPKNYQIGAFVTSTETKDGTFTDNIQCGTPGLSGTTCSGDAGFNTISTYQVRVNNGTWFLQTERQYLDSWTRKTMGDAPLHFHAEKENPLDFLKDGDKVMFRTNRPNGIVIYIPYADNPKKEVTFYGKFVSDASLAPKPQPKTDNIEAMCSSGRLSPDQQKQFCPK